MIIPVQDISSETAMLRNVCRSALPETGRPRTMASLTRAGEDKIVRGDFAVRLLTLDHADLARLHAEKSLLHDDLWRRVHRKQDDRTAANDCR